MPSFVSRRASDVCRPWSPGALPCARGRWRGRWERFGQKWKTSSRKRRRENRRYGTNKANLDRRTKRPTICCSNVCTMPQVLGVPPFVGVMYKGLWLCLNRLFQDRMSVLGFWGRVQSPSVPSAIVVCSLRMASMLGHRKEEMRCFTKKEGKYAQRNNAFNTGKGSRAGSCRAATRRNS